MSINQDNSKKKRKEIEVLTINKETIQRGDSAIVRINIGKLPSGTRINLDAHVFSGVNAGPTVLMLGGVHGDEINGIEIIRNCLFRDRFEDLQFGTVIAIPIVNVHGFIHFSRDVPDGKDVNRSFPGSSVGSMASRIAKAITTNILPHVDYIIDLHTGGGNRYNYPQIRYTTSDTKAFELAKVFGAPYIVKKPVIAASLRKIAREMSIPIIVFEGGEAQRYDGLTIDVGVNGIMRVLQHLGMKEFETQEPSKMYHFSKTTWVRASMAGLFMWSKKSGEMVQANEVIGDINDPQGSLSVSVVANMNGFILGHNNSTVVNEGDALFHITYDYEIL